ncbi:endolytic transglycosylase MltG [Priestia megaterium]|uniref:Endolytic murein transglycosylase n=1 Tax=Priestia megaterium TaxID=1404 RepID=A0A6M6E242_PRIMG|nr:endolytic transglycosylase MltG [Priestia megaterium]QJX80870.1 endolytic transglycosylase MltG [Priestia megaterium]
MKRFFIKFLVFIIVLAAVAVGGLNWFKGKSTVSPGSIDISTGASVRQVADLLEANGVIEDANVFYYYIRLKQVYYEVAPWSHQKFDVSFKPGKFVLDTSNFNSLITELNEIDNSTKEETAERYVTIPEGTTIEQMSEILSSRNIVDKDAFLRLVNDQEYYNELRKKYTWLPAYNPQKIVQLEGYLHADSYDFQKNTLPHKIIEQMLDETNKWYVENKVQILDTGYSFDQLITLASVVEKESKFSEDRPKVAQVFYNRLIKGMKLESDITASYANREHKVFMTYKDIDTESPYNTYRTSGLPLGPINSPSIESLTAVLHPTGSQFKAIYFYARPNGQTFYAETFAEHEVNRKKYEKEWLELAN